MTQTFAMVPFEDHQIMTVNNGDDINIVMKPIVEALGFDWASQFKRIKSHPVISKGVVVTTIPSVGGMQEMVSLKLESFHGWLLSIHPDRITDEAQRAVIMTYQEQAFRVIFEHFHGKPSIKIDQRNVAARIALQNQASSLAQKLQTRSNPAERRMLYQFLQDMCETLGNPPPPLDELGQDAPTPPDILQNFWAAIEDLRGRNVDFNHSRDASNLALNLTEVQGHFKDAGLHLPIDTDLKNALRQSASPKFIAHKAVNSRLDHKAKTCWVFKAA